MGYSLNGLNPTSKKGKSSGVWHGRAWEPLWELCCQLGADDLIPENHHSEFGTYDDGAGLCAKDSARLADRLTGIINLKVPEQMETAFKTAGHTLGEITVSARGRCINKKGKAKTPEQCTMFTAKDVRDLRDFFRDCGGFTID